MDQRHQIRFIFISGWMDVWVGEWVNGCIVGEWVAEWMDQNQNSLLVKRKI